MSDTGHDLAGRPVQRSRPPVVTVSPLLNAFAGPQMLFGLPLVFIWVFSVWTGLILLTRLLARRLDRGSDAKAGG